MCPNASKGYKGFQTFRWREGHVLDDARKKFFLLALKKTEE